MYVCMYVYMYVCMYLYELCLLLCALVGCVGVLPVTAERLQRNTS